MTAGAARHSRLHSAVFAPIGDEGRAALVEQRVAGAISAGALTDGERLPSESELARSLGVAVVTVREALVGLRTRGLIETRRGRSGGSFVTASRASAEAQNAATLLGLSRVALNELAVHYETIAAACAEFACLRATADELDVIHEILRDAGDLSAAAWRPTVTEVQLELAGLSQSVRLTQEHVRLQAEFTPLLALQDADPAARARTHDALLAQVRATIARDAPLARSIVRQSVRGSVRWLIQFRAGALAADAAGNIEAALRRRGE